MNINLQRHKLLKILSKQYIALELGKAKYNAFGVSFEVILNELGCSEEQLQLISSELYSQDEIKFHDAHNIRGLHSTEKGVSSYSNKKYIKLNNERIKHNIKDLVQILIPILSLLVAILAISIKINNLSSKTENEINSIKEKQKLIIKKFDKLEKSDETNFLIKKNDSL